MGKWNVIATAALGLFLSACERQTAPSDPPAQTAPSAQSDPPTATLTDATEVFYKAFWQRPTAGDEILHAERHDWRDAEGVTKWRWFLAVRASPGLLKYLRDDNAFGLVPAKSALLPDDKPAWFSFNPSEVMVLKSPRGKMQLVFQTRDNTLFAMDAGGGMQRGAPEPAPVKPLQSPPQPPAGRLPATPPPHPEPEPEP